MKNNPVALSRAMVSKTRIVPYLSIQEVRLLCQTAEKRRTGLRDSLLITLLFQTGLRISEALSLTARKIQMYEGHAVLYVRGKGNKDRMVACPDNLSYRLKAYAYSKNLKLDDRLFSITRVRAWQIMKDVAMDAKINKRVYNHIYRHSHSIYVLRQTGNPKALQIHLGHSSLAMVMHYLSTLTAEDALRIQQEVDFEKTNEY